VVPTPSSTSLCVACRCRARLTRPLQQDFKNITPELVQVSYDGTAVIVRPGSNGHAEAKFGMNGGKAHEPKDESLESAIANIMTKKDGKDKKKDGEGEGDGDGEQKQGGDGACEDCRKSSTEACW
jgi:hypothetical protein